MAALKTIPLWTFSEVAETVRAATPAWVSEAVQIFPSRHVRATQPSHDVRHTTLVDSRFALGELMHDGIGGELRPSQAELGHHPSVSDKSVGCVENAHTSTNAMRCNTVRPVCRSRG